MKDAHNVTYLAKVHGYQMNILIIQVFLMVIGGCVFGFGVVTRPILRITKPEFQHHVEWITDMMVAAGLAQLATAGYDCFAACWKLIWPIYLGIGVTAMTVCLEVGAIGFSLQLLHQADFMANEDVLHAWYWVECQKSSSCHDAMLSYIYSYVLPQIVLAAFAIFLQCLGMMYLSRLVRVIATHVKDVTSYGQWYRENMDKSDDPKLKKSTKKSSKKSKSELNFNDQATEEDNGYNNNQVDTSDEEESVGDKIGVPQFDVDYHTPSSILKVDHGYVAASGAPSYDDFYMRNRSTKQKTGNNQSISFDTNVQVHYYDAKENIEKGSIKKKPSKSSMKSTSKVRLVEAADEEEMDDLTPETIQLQCGQIIRKNSNTQFNLAKVATNLSKILAIDSDSPETPGQGQCQGSTLAKIGSGTKTSPYRIVEQLALDAIPPAPPSTPQDPKATFNYSPTPTINICSPEGVTINQTTRTITTSQTSMETIVSPNRSPRVIGSQCKVGSSMRFGGQRSFD